MYFSVILENHALPFNFVSTTTVLDFSWDRTLAFNCHAGQVHFATTDVYSHLSVAIPRGCSLSRLHSLHSSRCGCSITSYWQSHSLHSRRCGCSRPTDSRTHFTLVTVAARSRPTDSCTHFTLVAVAAHVLLTVALTSLSSLWLLTSY